MPDDIRIDGGVPALFRRVQRAEAKLEIATTALEEILPMTVDGPNHMRAHKIACKALDGMAEVERGRG